MILFLALCFVGIAIAGACAFLIFWPLALVHLRDRHPEVRARLGDAAFFDPRVTWWLLSLRYREVRDRAFTGLASPAWVALVTILVALALSGLLWLWSILFPEIGA
ncbi:hypothetical protein [Luteimonas sp. e5]